MPYVVICTGSRDLADRESVDTVLDTLLADHPDLEIRVGDCRSGLDVMVLGWAVRAWGRSWRTRCHVYYADWGTYHGFAGPMRNAEMVQAGGDEAHGWWAPPPAVNKGTAGCAQLARDAGIPVTWHGWGREAVEKEQETLI